MKRDEEESEENLNNTLIKLSESLGDDVPSPLIDVWTLNDGFSGDNVEFYSTTEILERNETLETFTLSRGYLAIANDAGSKVACVRLGDNSGEVFLNYMGDMAVASMESTGMTLDTWIAAGCSFDLDKEAEFSAIEKVQLRLDKMPSNGLAGLMRIKKTLNLVLPMKKLKEIPNQLPYTLCTSSYIKALRYAEAINKDEVCVSIWKDSGNKERMPLSYKF